MPRSSPAAIEAVASSAQRIEMYPWEKRGTARSCQMKLTIIQICLGVGLFALPYALSLSGFWFGAAGIMFIAYANAVNSEWLVMCKAAMLRSGLVAPPGSLNSGTFGYVAKAALGPYGPRFIDVSILITLLGCAVLYMITLANLLPPLLYVSSITSVPNVPGTEVSSPITAGVADALDTISHLPGDIYTDSPADPDSSDAFPASVGDGGNGGDQPDHLILTLRNPQTLKQTSVFLELLGRVNDTTASATPADSIAMNTNTEPVNNRTAPGEVEVVVDESPLVSSDTTDSPSTRTTSQTGSPISARNTVNAPRRASPSQIADGGWWAELIHNPTKLIIFLCIVLSPTMLVTDLTSISFVSVLGVSCYTLAVLAAMLNCMAKGPAMSHLSAKYLAEIPDSQPWYAAIITGVSWRLKVVYDAILESPLWGSPFDHLKSMYDLIEFVGVVAFSFGVPTLTYDLQESMARPSRLIHCLYVSLFGLGIVYAFVGLFLVAMLIDPKSPEPFGGIKAFVLLNLDASWVTALVSGGVALTVVCSLPVTLLIPGLNLLEVLVFGNLAAGPFGKKAAAEAVVAVVNVVSETAGVLTHSPMKVHADKYHHHFSQRSSRAPQVGQQRPQLVARKKLDFASKGDGHSSDLTDEQNTMLDSIMPVFGHSDFDAVDQEDSLLDVQMNMPPQVPGSPHNSHSSTRSPSVKTALASLGDVPLSEAYQHHSHNPAASEEAEEEAAVSSAVNSADLALPAGALLPLPSNVSGRAMAIAMGADLPSHRAATSVPPHGLFQDNNSIVVGAGEQAASESQSDVLVATIAAAALRLARQPSGTLDSVTRCANAPHRVATGSSLDNRHRLTAAYHTGEYDDDEEDEEEEDSSDPGKITMRQLRHKRPTVAQILALQPPAESSGQTALGERSSLYASETASVKHSDYGSVADSGVISHSVRLPTELAVEAGAAATEILAVVSGGAPVGDTRTAALDVRVPQSPYTEQYSQDTQPLYPSPHHLAQGAFVDVNVPILLKCVEADDLDRISQASVSETMSSCVVSSGGFRNFRYEPKYAQNAASTTLASPAFAHVHVPVSTTPYWVRAALRIAVLWVCGWVALKVPCFSLVMSFVGSGTIGLLCFILPPVFMLIFYSRGHLQMSVFRAIWVFTMLLFGIFAVASSIVVAATGTCQ